MSNGQLLIPFMDQEQVRSSGPDRIFVHLEQVEHNEQQDTVTMFDIQQMIARAKGGVSAKTYKAPGCSAWIEGDSIVMEFDFWAWPSDPDLIYTLSAGMGNVTSPQIITETVEFSRTFELSDVIEFDFILETLTSWRWETDCYDNKVRNERLFSASKYI